MPATTSRYVRAYKVINEACRAVAQLPAGEEELRILTLLESVIGER